MKGARIVLATTMTTGGFLGFTSQAASASTPEDLQKRLDALTAQSESLNEEMVEDRERVPAVRNTAAFSATSLVSLRAEEERIGDRITEEKITSSPLETMALLFTGPALTEADALQNDLSEVRVQVDAAAVTADRDQKVADDLAAAILRDESRKRTLDDQASSVKEQLKEHYTVGGITVYGADTTAKATRTALSKLGKPYVWGAEGPNSFDCSGLVVWSWAQNGKKGLPHYTGGLWEAGEKVERDDLRAGDLVFFHGGRSHMGIYVGDGKMVHAPSSGDVVKLTKLSERSDYNGAVRL